MPEPVTWRDIPQQAQRQDALATQLDELYGWATRLGMYDAADWLVDRLADKFRTDSQTT